MTYSSASQSSTSERVAMSMLAAGIMFVAGYTVVRVGFAQETTPTDSTTQVNAIPHQAALWTDAFAVDDNG
ncbi:MAG: hypothetical protein AAGD25_29015 [Cyanobacteria bacterium P01_F01_bin.150]